MENIKLQKTRKHKSKGANARAAADLNQNQKYVETLCKKMAYRSQPKPVAHFRDITDMNSHKSYALVLQKQQNATTLSIPWLLCPTFLARNLVKNALCFCLVLLLRSFFEVSAQSPKVKSTTKAPLESAAKSA